MWGRRERLSQFWWGNLKKRDHKKVDCRKNIEKKIFKKRDKK
jgi:hypothetical protein